MDELRIIEDEIILALTPDSLDMFLHILSKNEIFHLNLQIIGIPTTTLRSIEHEFPFMLLHFLHLKNNTYQMMEKLSMSIQLMDKRY